MVKILLLFEEERVIALQVADGTKNYTKALRQAECCR